MQTSRFTRFLALAICLTLCVSVFASCKKETSPDSKDVSKYLSLAEAFYRGQTLDMSASYVPPLTAADFSDYMTHIAMANRKLNVKSSRSAVIGEGDDVSFYVLGATLRGEPVMTDYFAAYNYTYAMTTTVGHGMDEEDFGETFDNALKGHTPTETHRSIRTDGKIEATDTVGLSYVLTVATAEKEGEYTFAENPAKNVNGSRTVIANLEERFRTALLESFRSIGETFTFTLSDYDYNGDGNVELAVRVEAEVSFVVTEEVAVTLPCVLPDGYLDALKSAEGGKDYSALKGEELSLQVILLNVDDYELPKVDEAFFTETLGFETDKTALADIQAAYAEKLAKDQNEANEKAFRTSSVQGLFAQIGATAKQNGSYTVNLSDRDDRVLQDMYEEAYEEAEDKLTADYAEFAYYCYQNGQECSLESYCYYQLYQSGYTDQQTDYPSYYLYVMAESFLYQKILMYHIFNQEKLSFSQKEFKDAYRKKLDGLKETYPGERYDDAYFESRFGKETLEDQVRYGLIYDKVGEFLLANNQVSTEKTGN